MIPGLITHQYHCLCVARLRITFALQLRTRNQVQIVAARREEDIDCEEDALPLLNLAVDPYGSAWIREVRSFDFAALRSG